MCESRSGVVPDATNGYQKILKRGDFGQQMHQGLREVGGCKNMLKNELTKHSNKYAFRKLTPSSRTRHMTAVFCGCVCCCTCKTKHSSRILGKKDCLSSMCSRYKGVRKQ